MILEGERVLLREFTADDHDAVHAFAGDADVVRFMDWGPNDRAATEAFLISVAVHQALDPRRVFELAITDSASGIVVGSCALHEYDASHRSGHIGYVLHPAWRGRGFATEASALLLELGFESLGLHRIFATCHPDNLASARVLERVGMRAEGRMRGDRLIRDGWRDSLLFARLATDPPPPR